MADNKGNKRIGSFNFDAETKLEVMQRGGGGAGVGGEDGLAAVNLVTGESTNDALAERDETIEEQAATIEEQAGTIEEQAGEISDLEDEVAAKQAIIDAFPTIEALSVTANGTYNEEGKAYKPVTVNVATGLTPDKAPFAICFDNNFQIVNNTANDINIFMPYATIKTGNDPVGATYGGVDKFTIAAGATRQMASNKNTNMCAVNNVRNNTGDGWIDTDTTVFSYVFIIEGGTPAVSVTPTHYTASVNGNKVYISIPKTYINALVPTTGRAVVYVSDPLTITVS